MILVLLLYALFASVFTIAKTGLEYSQPLFFVGVRMAFAGIFLLAYQLLFSKDRIAWNRLKWSKILLLGLCNIYLTNVCEFWGLKYLTSIKTCLIYSLSPFLSALFSYLIFSEKMSFKKWGGLIIGCVGLLPILLQHTVEEESAGQFFIFSWPELAVLSAAVLSVYGWILLRQLVREEGHTPILVNGLSMLFGGFLATMHSSLTENWNPIPVTEILPFVECSLLLIVISNLICYNLYGYLLRRFSATFMSFAGFTTPFFTALFGWIYLGESVSWTFFLATTIQLGGLFLFYQEELLRKPAAQQAV